MVEQSYLLMRHVFACFRQEHVVFLDLKRNQYFALAEGQSRMLASVLCGGPTCAQTEPAQVAMTAEATTIADALVSRGLLTIDPLLGKPYCSPAIGSPAKSLSDEYLLNEIRITPRHVAAFVTSCAVAAAARRWRGIENIVSAMKRETREQDRARANQSTASVHQLYTVFERLRPWFYTASDACLYDCLALLSFLARFGTSATWVFGVRTAPFGAHCWLQDGELILNDTPEHVGQYTPIMAV